MIPIGCCAKKTARHRVRAAVLRITRVSTRAAYESCVSTKSSNRISSDSGLPIDAKISVISRWKVFRADGIKIVLAVAAGLDQAGDAEQRQVMADGRLALAELVAQRRHVQFPFAGQIHQHAQAGFIRQQLEDLDEILLQLVRQFRNGSPTFGLHRFHDIRDHFFPSTFRMDLLIDPEPSRIELSAVGAYSSGSQEFCLFNVCFSSHGT